MQRFARFRAQRTHYPYSNKTCVPFYCDQYMTMNNTTTTKLDDDQDMLTWTTFDPLRPVENCVRVAR